MDFKSMTAAQLEDCRKEWHKKQLDKAKPKKPLLRSDDWECEKCQTVNKMNEKDIQSSLCRKCKAKNDIVAYLIEGKTNKVIQTETAKDLKVYNDSNTESTR